MDHLENVIKEHILQYPAMEIQDMVKLLYQNEFGGGHLVSDAEASYESILAEMNGAAGDLNAPVFQDIGGGICRIHLSPFQALFQDQALAAKVLNVMFLESSAMQQGNLAFFHQKLNLLLNMVKYNSMLPEDQAVSGTAWMYDYYYCAKYIEEYEKNGCPMLRHSDIYRENYKPAYRIVLKEFSKYVELFLDIRRQRRQSGQPCVVAIDGRCGSGKSTLAKMIGRIFDCPVIHMDDFFLPQDLRCEERLSAPGGNIHYERVLEEVIHPLSMGQKRICHRVFDCSAMDYAAQPKEVEISDLLVIEGSYSMRPEFLGAYHMNIFMDISQEAQRKRIIGRSGEASFKAFESKWIPMENRYIEHYGVPALCYKVYKTE